jgi:hypothetical protein
MEINSNRTEANPCTGSGESRSIGRRGRIGFDPNELAGSFGDIGTD